MDIKKLYEIFLAHQDITTDSRNIKEGQIFFALKGPAFNGNLYALEALEKGAAFAIVDEDIHQKNDSIIITDDVLITLQDLAKHHRLQLNIPFLAITGSNGKTTTKELVSAVLSSTHKTVATIGNLNNHIGIPLTILKVPVDTEIAVIEMGANHQKEIESYCKYTLPTHGLITNCGKAHLEGFGGVEGVIKGKGELFDFIKQTNGIAFVNNYDKAIKKLSENILNKCSYGPGSQTEGSAKMNKDLLSVTITSENSFQIQTSLVGDYNLPNVLAAVAVGRHFKVSDRNIKLSIENYKPSNSRSQLIIKDNNEIILDAYNANPSSMKAAIDNFASIDGQNKYVILGSMAELGDASPYEHKKVIDLIDQYKWSGVVLVGDNFNTLSHNYVGFKTVSEAKEWFRSIKLKNAKILIKGSRSMQMEKVLD